MPPPPSQNTFKLTHDLKSHKGPVHTVVWNSGASYCLSGGQDRNVNLWNPSTGNLVKTYSGHGYEVLGIAVAPDNHNFSSCGGDRSVILWDVATATVVKRFPGHTGKINAVGYNEDGSVLASGSYDSTIRLWDMRSQQRMPIQVLEEAKDSITSLRLKGSTIFSGSVDGFLRSYDVRMGEVRSDYLGQPITSLSLLSDSISLLISLLALNPSSSSSNSQQPATLHLLDLSTGQSLNQFTGHKNENYRISAGIGVAETNVMMGDEDGYVWEWETGGQPGAPPRTKQRLHDKSLLSIIQNPKIDSQVITAGADGAVKIWQREGEGG